jgi:SH3-like domain-containing protein
VGWEVAIVRDKPKEGEIVARILRGTRVIVTGRQDDWYRIKYDAKGTEGWVFGAAIGL